MYDTALIIAGTEAEYQSDAGSTEDTPYCALMGELWDGFCWYFLENWPHHNSTALYITAGCLLQVILEKMDLWFDGESLYLSMPSLLVKCYPGCNLDVSAWCDLNLVLSWERDSKQSIMRCIITVPSASMLRMDACLCPDEISWVAQVSKASFISWPKHLMNLTTSNGVEISEMYQYRIFRFWKFLFDFSKAVNITIFYKNHRHNWCFIAFCFGEITAPLPPPPFTNME